MKKTSIIAFLVIGAVIFYVTGGGALLGLGGSGANLPETTQPPNATFMGYEQENPYVDEEPAQS